jgi:hypothetical protein
MVLKLADETGDVRSLSIENVLQHIITKLILWSVMFSEGIPATTESRF